MLLSKQKKDGLITRLSLPISKPKFIKKVSLCVESGYTFFGLVEQDYELPTEIQEKLGYDILEYEIVDFEEFEYECFEYKEFNYAPFNYETLDIVILKRGLVGIRKIRYL